MKERSEKKMLKAKDKKKLKGVKNYKD